MDSRFEKGFREVVVILTLMCVVCFQLSAYGAEKAKHKTSKADSAKMISGMSIVGNTEAPKSLVIVPWKSSQIGFQTSLRPMLDGNVRPVDKEVFMREIHYYEMTQGK